MKNMVGSWLVCTCCLLTGLCGLCEGQVRETRYAGEKVTIRFTVDLGRIDAKRDFANLFCRGKDFEDGFCVMVRKNGQVLVDVKGIEPGYYLTRTTVPSNRACQLEVYLTPTCVRLFFDGQESDSYPYVGTPDVTPSAGDPHVGSFGNYPLPGEVTSLTFDPLCAVTLPPGGPKPMIQELPMRQARAEIKWSKVICKEKDRYIGWPTVVRLKNGDLIAAFSGDREAHVCPWGKTQIVRSTDDGETWEGPITVQNGPIDDRDCGIFQMPNGDVVITYFTSTAYRTKKLLETDWTPDQPQYWWKRHDEKLTDEVRREASGCFRLVSKDNGQTWSKPMRMIGGGTTPHGPIVLRDGSLFQLIGGPVSAWRSDDGGANWRCLCPRLPDADEGKPDHGTYHEPNAIELPNGTLLGFIRCDDGDHHLRQTVSTDGGRTWSPMTATSMVGLPPHVIRLADGKLLCAYGRRVPQGGFGTFATLSDDEGLTWDVANEICLRPCFKGDGDLAYPTSCQLPNGDIVTVFYQPDAKGEKPCLMATKWRVLK